MCNLAINPMLNGFLSMQRSVPDQGGGRHLEKFWYVKELKTDVRNCETERLPLQ
jgi:hypothetical protein